MSEFKFSCPHCGQHLQGDPLWSGREINCPVCQRILLVPSDAHLATARAEPVSTTWTSAAAAASWATAEDRLTVSSDKEHGLFTSADFTKENEHLTNEGLVKLDTDTTLESFLMGGAVAALVVALGAGKIALLGHRRSPPSPELLPVALWALPFCLVFFIAYCFTDNYYLLDRERQRILYHFKFLWFRRIRVFLQREDILAVAVQGHKASERRGPTYWEYRVGVVGTNGRWVALTEWKKEALEPCNRQAASLAGMLGCKAHSASARCELAVRKKDGAVSITYVPLRRGTTRKERWLLLVVVLLVLGAVLYVSLST